MKSWDKPIEIVTWRDACYQNEPIEIKEAIKGYVQVTVGFLLSECDDFIHLGMEGSRTDIRWRHVMGIPKVNIVKRKRIPAKFTKGLLDSDEEATD